MKRAEIVIPGNPGIVLARVAPLFSSWLGEEGCVLGGGTVLAARWQHRVSTDIDLFKAERATIASELRTLPHHWSSGEPVREPAYPDLLPDVAGRARRLFEADLGTIGQDRGT